MHSHHKIPFPKNVNQTIIPTIIPTIPTIIPTNSIIKYIPIPPTHIQVNYNHKKIISYNTDIINLPYFHHIYTKRTFIIHILDLYKK